MWEYGELDGYQWEAKVYDKGSIFGIGGGRVSKLSITGKDVDISYERGWGKEPVNEAGREILAKVLALFPEPTED